MEDDKQNELNKLMAKLKEEMASTKILEEKDYPVAISGVAVRNGLSLMPDSIKVGTYVSVRPCGDYNAENKTFLGIYLGELLAHVEEPVVLMDTRTSKLLIGTGNRTNPAIYVPDLKRVVWGCESWWGVIESPEELRQITDIDIQGIWYVQALKALSKEHVLKPHPDEEKARRGWYQCSCGAEKYDGGITGEDPVCPRSKEEAKDEE